MKTISLETYNELKAKMQIFDAWVDSIRGRNGWASYKENEIPAHLPRVTNEERSQVEVYEFINNPPDKYFCYIRRVDTQGVTSPSSLRFQATTWMGDVLGTGILGRQYKSPVFGSFPSTRYPLRFQGINGKTYFGTYYASSGSYARVKQTKGTK